MACVWVYLLLLLLPLLAWCHRQNIACSDPDVTSTSKNKDRKFLLLGSEGGEGAGLGNLLIFYPSAFWFASFTNRNIIIADGSIIGEMCRIIKCGFPFASEIALAFPELFKEDKTLKHVEDIKHTDMLAYMDGSKNITANVVRGWGYQAMSDWWVYFNTTVHCVHRITGCDLGDIPCGDRHAYQRLIRGPFKDTLTEKEETRISGVPNHIKHAILSLPHSYAPRLDAAIHIRTQFAHFENQADINDIHYKKEVSDWLNSSECATVFKNIEEKLVEEITAIRLNDGNATNDQDPIYVYLASDNEEVKDAFIRLLEKQHGNDNTSDPTHLTINVMRVDSAGIFHVKNLKKMQKLSNNEGILDLIFDWYALTLANLVFAWRKGGTNQISTFVHSAQRVSGTTDRSDVRSPIGHGIGTKGLQLIQNKRGNYYWDHFWAYTFLEDYQIKRRAQDV